MTKDPSAARCLRDQGPEDLAQTAIRGLFPGPRPPRQVADFSVGKLVVFLAAPHQAEMMISSASHSATQLAALHVVRTTWMPPPAAELAGPAPGGPGGPCGPAGPCSPCAPEGPGGPASPFGPSVDFPHAPKASAKTPTTTQLLIFMNSPRRATQLAHNTSGETELYRSHCPLRRTIPQGPFRGAAVSDQGRKSAAAALAGSAVAADTTAPLRPRRSTIEQGAVRAAPTHVGTPRMKNRLLPATRPVYDRSAPGEPKLQTSILQKSCRR